MQVQQLANKSGKNNSEDSHIESLKKELTLIQHGTKIEDGQSVSCCNPDGEFVKNGKIYAK